MRYPALPSGKTVRNVVTVFRGLNKSPRIDPGELADMKNLTSDSYPVLSPRRPRGLVEDAASASGLLAKDCLCRVEGREFVMNGVRVDLGLAEGQKQLVSMGAYVIILPDRVWINTLDLSRYGSVDASVSTVSDVVFQLSTVDGEVLGEPTVSEAAPEAPKTGDLWLEQTQGSLYRYTGDGGWVEISSVYVRLSSPGIGKAFGQYDGVELSGICLPGLEALNGPAVIWHRGEDHIVIPGLLRRQMTQLASEGPVTVTRRMPEMDYIVEAGNRLWGCRYGISRDGQLVNEIYASKLGDFKNWNCFMGVSTDSWRASVGSDGPFTGAVTHLGYPLFFKETCLHKVYISDSGAHALRETVCRGVQSGCGNTLATVGETLFYKSRRGVCVYDGSLPEEISRQLGDLPCRRAAAGAAGNKYYLSLEGLDGTWQMLVWDNGRRLWHREDAFGAVAFCACREELYAIEAASGRIYALLGSGTPEPEPVAWMAETGDLNITEPESRYLYRLQLQLFLERGATVRVSARYDDDRSWTQLCSLRGTGLKRFLVPVRPRRCSRLRLRLEGEGYGMLYAIIRTGEKGSQRL